MFTAGTPLVDLFAALESFGRSLTHVRGRPVRGRPYLHVVADPVDWKVTILVDLMTPGDTWDRRLVAAVCEDAPQTALYETKDLDRLGKILDGQIVPEWEFDNEQPKEFS